MVTVLLSCNKTGAEELLLLSNNEIEVGILPEVGGRIVLLKKPGKENILKSDSTLWKNANKKKPKISSSTNFVAYNGNITWIGPQKEWWTHQNLNIERKKNKSDWPPEPYLIYSTYQIVEQTESYIKLSSPVSPINGLSLVKEYTITNDGMVKIKVTAKNERNEKVNWDLWMLTRLDGFANVYVPVEEDGILELVIKDNEKIETTPYQIENDHFTFNPSLPQNGKMEQVQEVHLYPSKNYLAGFSKKQMLLIRFNKIKKELVYPKHGLVELYNSTNKNGKDSLLELEIHGAYTKLLPGETMALTEVWQIENYDGVSNTDEQIKFIEQIISDTPNNNQ